MTQRKGLNTPNLNKNTPLDATFAELSSFLEINESAKEDIIEQLYNKTLDKENAPIVHDKLTQLNSLIPTLFKFIHTIQDQSIEQSIRNKKSKDHEHLIAISLHDMKIFNELLNLIIVQFIYPLLPNGIGIPLEQRRLKSFNKTSKLYQFRKVNNGTKTLEAIVKEFVVVFSKKGDLRDLLIKGSGLTDIITVLIVLIHDSSPDQYKTLEFFESCSDTYNLFSTYTILIQNTPSSKYKKFIGDRLANLTLNRPNGVSSLIDFVVGIRDDEEINIEKFSHVNRILMTKPKDINSVEYFTKIFNQIYDILSIVNTPVMNSVAVNFIKTVYQSNGRIIRDFLFKRIWESIVPPADLSDFDYGDTIIGAKKLNDAVNVLLSLIKETSIEFLNELFGEIILNLWNYYMYLTKKSNDYSNIISNILVSFFTITSNNVYMENIILNLIQINGESWNFQSNLENSLVSVVKSNPLTEELKVTNEDIFDDIDLGLRNITKLFKDLNDDVVRYQFLRVLNRWISKKNDESALDIENPFIMLIDLKFLEKINETFKDSLLDKPEDVLLVIKNLLIVKLKEKPILEKEAEDEEVDSDDEDEEDVASVDNLSILLELLSAIISETNPIELSNHKSTLKEISKILAQIETDKHCLALSTRINEFLTNDGDLKRDYGKDEFTKDKELFEKAITNMNDPLVPIRAHGLYLLRQLIVKKSDVLSLDLVLELHINQLKDSEPFIYLNVIKSLNELLEFNQNETIRFLINFYVNKAEPLDDRLKIGEVLLNFILKTNELLNGPVVDEVISKTLGIIRDFEEDDRIRMSAMSLIGQALRVNAIGLDKFIKDSLDCSIGILELEKNETMKRSAVVLISDLISFGGLGMIPKGYGSKLKTILQFNKVNSNDYLLVEQIDKVLEVINDLIKGSFDVNLPKHLETLNILK